MLLAECPFIEAGMMDYVSKPINSRKLFATSARCTGLELAGIPQGTEVARRSAHDEADASDAATDLQYLMGDLDALIEEA